MRLRTYLYTYLLFLCVLFFSVGTVSVYLTHSQTQFLREKSAREYHTIASTLSRDLTTLYDLISDPQALTDARNTLISGYTLYYRRHNIEISLTDLRLSDPPAVMDTEAELVFIGQGRDQFISITGTLPPPFQFYQLEYALDISEELGALQSTRQILLFSSILFSVLAAVALYFILLRIFRPLELVADASRKIAGGEYSERIRQTGGHELSQMAADFNRMAQEIETQIGLLEEEVARMQQFVDNFAHEIRTPLTSIYGYAEYLQKASLREEELIESSGQILNEARHMKKIANSLLELATLRHYAPAKTEIFIPALFDDIRQSLEKPLHEAGVSLHCDSDAETLLGQADLIRSLLLNLCFNALAASRPGEGSIHLSAYKDGGDTVLSVRDNGRGIPPEGLEKVTEPFYRVDKARSRTEGGTGLGLSLCKQIAQVHGAQLKILSQVDVGTEIRVRFTAP